MPVPYAHANDIACQWCDDLIHSNSSTCTKLFRTRKGPAGAVDVTTPFALCLHTSARRCNSSSWPPFAIVLLRFLFRLQQAPTHRQTVSVRRLPLGCATTSLSGTNSPPARPSPPSASGPHHVQTLPTRFLCIPERRFRPLRASSSKGSPWPICITREACSRTTRRCRRSGALGKRGPYPLLERRHARAVPPAPEEQAPLRGEHEPGRRAGERPAPAP